MRSAALSSLLSSEARTESCLFLPGMLVKGDRKDWSWEDPGEEEEELEEEGGPELAAVYPT